MRPPLLDELITQGLPAGMHHPEHEDDLNTAGPDQVAVRPNDHRFSAAGSRPRDPYPPLAAREMAESSGRPLPGPWSVAVPRPAVMMLICRLGPMTSAASTGDQHEHQPDPDQREREEALTHRAEGEQHRDDHDDRQDGWCAMASGASRSGPRAGWSELSEVAMAIGPRPSGGGCRCRLFLRQIDKQTRQLIE